ncbi:MAG: LTA synthase family protein [Polyangiales bacterium]
MGWALVVLVCVGAPLLTRVLLLQEKHLPLRLVDVRGLVADISVALVAMGVVSLFLEIGRWWGRALAVAALIMLVLASFAMYEFISVFDSLYALSHVGFLGDSTFLGGSVRHVQHPAWIILLTASAVAGAIFARAPSKRWWAFWGVALASSVATLAIIPVSLTYDEWRQRQALEANVSILSASANDGPVSVGADLREVFGADLQGERWVEPLGLGTNVLLIMLEGASGAYLPSVAAAQGVQSSTVMPQLDALAQKNILLSRVISHQRQTNRGEYGILCGDYPKLLTDQSKMIEQAYGTAHRCLPAVLRDAGYATVYIQAAPLGFMLKDQFMPKAGFQELIGEPWFERAYARTDWGVDDKAFFEQALPRVLALHRAKRPFFATLLTVGTHHPYTIPATADSGGAALAPSRHDLAFRWADEAVTDFLSALEQHGVLRDTVVFITSDESAGLTQTANATQTLLSQSWSFVVVMLPAQETRRIDTLVEHVDSAISVADLLGMDQQATRFVGRSWFRQYDTPRPMFSANTYARSVMMWEPSGSVVICGESLRRCVRSVPEDDLVFGPVRHREPVAPRERQLLSEVARLTRSGRGDLTESGALTLLTDKEARVRAEEGKKLLIGGQYLRVPAGSTLQIELDLTVEGEQAAVEFHQETFLDGYPKLVRKGVRVHDGQRWHLRYDVGVPRDASQLVVELYAKTVSGDAATIRFDTAQLTMARAGATSADVVIIADDLSPGDPPRR